MKNTATQNGNQSTASEKLQDKLVIEQSEELSSHMLFTPENCRVWWQGYYLQDENIN